MNKFLKEILINARSTTNQNKYLLEMFQKYSRKNILKDNILSTDLNFYKEGIVDKNKILVGDIDWYVDNVIYEIKIMSRDYTEDIRRTSAPYRSQRHKAKKQLKKWKRLLNKTDLSFVIVIVFNNAIQTIYYDSNMEKVGSVIEEI